MIGRFVLAGLLLLPVTRIADANGRPPSTSTITFRTGMDSEVVAGTTFGLIKSTDGGATWRWMCEDSIGYGGMYDPDYAYGKTGTLFATTFTGLKANRDGCQFEMTPSGSRFVSTTTVGPDGALYFAAADLMDGKIYKSTDDGVTFPISSLPNTTKDWWVSIEVAPSNASRVYLSGYRVEAGLPKVFLMFRSDDGALTWTPTPIGDFATMPNSEIQIVGVSRTDPDRLYAKVALADNALAEAVYRSTNGGQSWTRILEKPEPIAVLVRGSGELIAGTRGAGVFKSGDGGATWQDLTGAPHINCLAESEAGEVWACTQNYGTMQAPSDEAGIMKTSDLATWTKVLRYQDIREPVVCAPGTVQHDTCDLDRWCGFCAQLGCQPDPSRSCPGFQTDIADPGGGGGGGCCEASAGGPGAFALTGLVALGLAWPRRRRSRDRG